MDFDDFVQGATGPVETILVVGWFAVVAYFRYRRTFSRRSDWLLLVAAWAYLIVDFDLLPEHKIGLPGLLDDALVMAGVATWVYRNSSPRGTVKEQVRRWLDDPDQPEPDWYSSGERPPK